MKQFYNGFEKHAGFADFFSKIKSFFTPKKEVPKPQAPTGVPQFEDRKPPEYFRWRSYNPATTKLLNKTIKGNKTRAEGMVTIKYKKANGDVVTRKVTPYTAKNKNLLLGHDHTRGELRSFRVDRIQSIK